MEEEGMYIPQQDEVDEMIETEYWKRSDHELNFDGEYYNG